MSIGKRRADVAQQPTFDPTRCAAHGCPFRGSIDRESSGRFLCLCHDAQPPHDWPRITEQCREHSWLGDFIADLQHLSRRDSKTFAEFATRFWEQSDASCVPTRWECGLPAAYILRMLAELRWRCGVSKTRPSPQHEPARAMRPVMHTASAFEALQRVAA